MKCAFCGHENVEESVLCSECGMKLKTPLESEDNPGESDPEGVRCQHCGFINLPGASVCSGCHEKILARPETHSCSQCGADNPASAQFCMNCGAGLTDQATLATVQPVAHLVLPTGKEIPVSDLKRFFGRTDFLKEIPPEKLRFISRKHFYIVFENGIYYIGDERSTNGTKLNGEEIKGQKKQELTNGDEIVLANTVRLEFKIR